MSYFPSGDIPTPPASNSPHCFTTPLQRQQHEWQEGAVVQTYDHSRQRESPYRTDICYGLGLPYLPTNSQAYLEMDVVQQQLTSATPFIWPSQFANTGTPQIYPQPVRLPQWSDGSCDPRSTLMTGTHWDLPQLAPQQVLVYQDSPALSEWAPSSHNSVLSSPYARSDSVLRSAGSPKIKLEQGIASPARQISHTPQTAYLEQALIVNPRDLTAQPEQPMKHETEDQYDPASVSDNRNSESPIVRSNGRRASASGEERKKRTYTRPDTATCQCEECGKLFQRTYNLRAHMETHDPQRRQPYVCAHDACEKRFVRRTDLLRHEQSVSLLLEYHTCKR